VTARGAAAQLVLIALTGAAHADPAPAAAAAGPASTVDPVAISTADDANLVSSAPRRGVTASLFVGASLTLGLHVRNAIGEGGAFGLRLGHAATRRTVLTFEVLSGVYKTSVAGIEKNDQSVGVMAGAQVWVLDSLWFRGAGGVGTLQRNSPGDSPRVSGLSFLAGAGVEALRVHWFTLQVEGFVDMLIAGGGAVFVPGLGVSVGYE
jgi:hypothetical protein